MQAHGFEQHLVAVGGAVKGAGALAVVGLVFGFEQFGAAHQALRSLLTHFGFGVVGEPRCHRPGGYKHRGQMAKMQSADQEARHNFVAHTQHQCSVEHVMAQTHSGGHGDHVAAEQAQLHTRCALCHPVAHGGHATRHLRRCTQPAGLSLDDVRVMLQRRMGRQHIVVRVDDGNVGGTLGHHPQLVVDRQRSNCMRNVGATQAVAATLAIGGNVKALQIEGSGALAAISNALRHGCHGRMKLHGNLLPFDNVTKLHKEW